MENGHLGSSSSSSSGWKWRPAVEQDLISRVGMVSSNEIDLNLSLGLPGFANPAPKKNIPMDVGLKLCLACGEPKEEIMPAAKVAPAPEPEPK